MKSPFLHLVLALVVCIAALTGYGFWYSMIANKSVAVTKLQSKIDAKTLAVSRMATTRAALTEIASDEAVVQNYFVPETGVVSFIDGLEERGRALGSTVEVLSVSSENTSARPTLDFNLSVKGTFDAVMRTVGAIEQAPYDISVAALTVGQDVKDSWHADLKLLVGSTSKTP
ncbi:MAG: hypothetical protein WC217_03820 [Candidatus Paceibacterota bacterium]|jgi:hypothetical protein